MTGTQTGLSTRTVQVTTTVSGDVVKTSTITQTATLVNGAAAISDNTVANPTSTGAAGRIESANSVVALVAAALGAIAVA